MPFQTGLRPELSLKRRIVSHPLENDSTNPFEGDGAIDTAGLRAGLQSAWDKLYRARALLEAEQAHLRDDRIALQGEAEAIAGREQALAQREHRIHEVEAHARRIMEEAQERDSQSPFARLTRAPFEMARSVFGLKE
jgi:hypothetical protein